MKYYSIGDFAELIGVTQQTLIQDLFILWIYENKNVTI
jgi:hypothetical protein